KLLAGVRLYVKGVVLLAPDDGYFLAKVHAAVKRLDLLQEVVCQLFSRAYGDSRDVVDRLVRVKLGTLAAGFRNRIDNLRLQPQQAELEHLEQAARTGSDDNDICIDHSSAPLNSRRYCPYPAFGRPIPVHIG